MPLHDDGRSSGTALIEFDSPSASATAVRLNGKRYAGQRWVNVKYADERPVRSRQPSKKFEGCSQVFIGNLAWDVDEEAVREFFQDCGQIDQVRFSTDCESRKFKGFGHVEFAESDRTDKAVAKAGQDLMGRPIRVDFSAPRERPSFRGGGRVVHGGHTSFFLSPKDGRRGGCGRRGSGQGGRGGGHGGGFSATNAEKSGTIAVFSGNKIKIEEGIVDKT